MPDFEDEPLPGDLPEEPPKGKLRRGRKKPPQQEKPRRRMRLKTKLILFLVFCLFLFGVFLAGVICGGRSAPEAVTSSLVSERLEAVQELVTLEYHYTNMGKYENKRDFYGWQVPFTTKRFLVSYDGVIKAGIDVSETGVHVSGRTITITLPPSKVLSHEIDENSIEVFDETSNIFNPIKISDYTGFTQQEKSETESKAIEKGLLTEADAKAKAAIRSLLSAIPSISGYSVVFS